MPPAPSPARFEVEILVQSALWASEPGAESTIRTALSALDAHLPASIDRGEIAIVLCDDSAIQCLNRDWRGLDKPTNVLSFPAAPGPGPLAGPKMLGDIAIAFETLRREAERDAKAFADHLAHLAIHGVLHLAGYDHEDDDEAQDMEACERAVLARLGIADPYA